MQRQAKKDGFWRELELRWPRVPPAHAFFLAMPGSPFLISPTVVRFRWPYEGSCLLIIFSLPKLQRLA